MFQPVFTPFPELTTDRLLLRKISLEDAPDIYFLRSDPAIMQFISKDPAANINEAIQFITRINSDIQNNEAIMWAIVLKNNPAKTIGNICFWRLQKEHYRAELGYVLDPGYWRKGIMKEAIEKVLEYGFTTMGLHSAEARIHPGNNGSAGVLESVGFVREAYFKEDFFFKGKFEDTAVYSRLR